jgi:hypothetical protein
MGRVLEDHGPDDIAVVENDGVCAAELPGFIGK